MISLDASLKGIVEELRKLGSRGIQDFFSANEDKIFSNEFEEKLKTADPADVFDFMLLIPANYFARFLDNFGHIISEKIANADIRSVAKIFDQLPKDLRKEFNARFRNIITDYVEKLSIPDMVTMINNVSAPARPGLLSPMKPILFNPQFKEKILEVSISDLENFISTLPEDIRKQFLSKHKEVFLSDEFGKKLKEASNEEITNLVLRWFTGDLYNRFVTKHKAILEEKGLRLPL